MTWMAFSFDEVRKFVRYAWAWLGGDGQWPEGNSVELVMESQNRVYSIPGSVIW